MNITSTSNGKIKVTKYLTLFGTIASSIHNFLILFVGAVMLVVVIILIIVILTYYIWMRKRLLKVKIEGIVIFKIS